MDHYGMAVETMWSDDGIVFRLPESADELPVAEILVDPDEIDELVLGALPSTSLFSSRFRECAARALLLPRRRPDSRTPLWQQRQRAADLLSVAAKYPTFPILLEASRECLQDVFDVPALRTVLADLRSRQDPARHRRHAEGLAVRPEPAVQLDRHLHVRGRRSLGRAPRRGAGPRPGPAPRAAGGRGAARAHRCRRAGRPRARPAVPQRPPAGPLGRRGPRPPASPRRPEPRRDRPSLGRAGRRGRVGRVAGRASGAPSCCGSPARSATWRPRTRRATATPSAPPCPSACRRRSPSPSSGRSSSSSPASPAPTGPSRPARSPGGSPRRSSGSWGRCEPWRPRAGWCWASSGPTAWSGSGATPRSCASSGGARSPRSARRSSRSSPRRWPGSCRPGRASARVAGASRPWSRRWACCRARPSRPAPSTSTSSRSVSRGTGPPTSTRCAPPAIWCGSAPAARGRATGRCGCSSATRSRCWRGGPTSTTDRAASCTTPCGSTSGVAAPASGPTCSPARRARPTSSCSPPCGTSCGPARSPTTRSHRCGRS